MSAGRTLFEACGVAYAVEFLRLAAGAVMPLVFSPGTLTVAPGLTPSTVFNTATGKWDTKQAVAVGAVNLATISFISAAVLTLPPSVGVRHLTS